jgi:membrane-bound lytic murein transglycosylase A
VLAANERYVFFREVDEGPVGSMGVVLTPGRSVAADPSRYAAGTLAWLETTIPIPTGDGRFDGARRAARLVVVQDTGSAITGPGRIDLFFGTGNAAGEEAGGMASTGELVFLFPDCG